VKGVFDVKTVVDITARLIDAKEMHL